MMKQLVQPAPTQNIDTNPKAHRAAPAAKPTYHWARDTSIWQAIFQPTIGSRPIWVATALFVFLSILGIAVVVYETGGTTRTYPYLILMPIIFAASIFKIPGGVIAGFIAAISVGPWMPLDVASGVMQTTHNWVLRMMMFLTIGGFTGLLSTLMYVRQQELILKERIDPVTGLISPVATLRLVAGTDAKAKLEFCPEYAVVVAYEGLSSVLRALGIEATNKAIFKIGQQLQAAVGNHRLVTRIHGSTFAILLPPGRYSIHEFAQAIQQNMPETIPIESFSLILQSRYGVAKLTDQDRQGGQTFRKAMAALTLARKKGRRIARYSSSFDQKAKYSLLLISELDRALRDEELKVFFQPKVDLATGDVVGVEALVRWYNRDVGEIPPDIFVPIIEKTNLIDAMTRHVADRAFQQMAIWNKMGLNLELALNISPILFSNVNFLGYLKSLPDRYGITPEMVEIEITETALMDDLIVMQRAFDDLRAHGFRLAIDDFGTGYSSLLYLKNFPIQTVKLDQSFVRDLPENTASAEISSMTAAICKRMNYRAVAEGVETPEAEALVRDLGFDVGQGYLYAKPMSATDLTAWMHRYRENRTTSLGPVTPGNGP